MWYDKCAKRSSNAHAKGRFAKNFYVSHQRMPKYGILRLRFEIPQSGIMEVGVDGMEMTQS